MKKSNFENGRSDPGPNDSKIFMPVEARRSQPKPPEPGRKEFFVWTEETGDFPILTVTTIGGPAFTKCIWFTTPCWKLMRKATYPGLAKDLVH